LGEVVLPRSTAGVGGGFISVISQQPPTTSPRSPMGRGLQDLAGRGAALEQLPQKEES